jgi:starch synthase
MAPHWQPGWLQLQIVASSELMRLLLASSEVHPYSKSGGLADMVGALAKALGRAGHEVGVVTPLYRGIREKFLNIAWLDYSLNLLLGAEWVQAQVFTLQPGTGVTIYFVDCPRLYDRAGLYNENHADYPDNAQRFIFFSKCVAHLARYLALRPEIVHVHDWQTALVPLLILHQKSREGWNTAPRTCLTIHNLAYQGNYSRETYSFTNLPLDYFRPDGTEFWGFFSLLKTGISFADLLTTVSPRYAREITTAVLGCGMDDALRGRKNSLVGILNGVDYEEWNTTHNPNLPHPYSAANLAGKAAIKADLQKELGLPVAPNTPLFASITRLAHQKGIDIEMGALEEMLAADLQFILLGSGEPQFERAFRNLTKRFPRKTAVRIGFNHTLAHHIEAGADFFLMPSRYEPCGLNQMYSLRYGTIPIVRVTGGLDDSVTDITEDLDRADGIKFFEYSARALAKAVRKALVLYQQPDLFDHMRRNAMKSDFSWDRTCHEYVREFERLLR